MTGLLHLMPGVKPPVSFKSVINDSSCIELCTCVLMDVGQQFNGSDCGVLAIAFAFVICCGNDPCSVRFNYKSITHHFAKCLEEFKFSCFPILGERNSTGMKHVQKTELICSCRLPEKIGDKMAE